MNGGGDGAPRTPTVFAWDASAMVHALRADRLDVLMDLARQIVDGPPTHVTTELVRQELAGHGLELPDLVEVRHVDGLDEVVRLVDWMQRLGATTGHNRGEATVCAWAEVHGAVVIMDDGGAREAARTAGLEVHGTLWIVSQAVVRGAESRSGAEVLVSGLMDTGARYPFRPGCFCEWAEKVGLLPRAPGIDLRTENGLERRRTFRPG